MYFLVSTGRHHQSGRPPPSHAWKTHGFLPRRLPTGCGHETTSSAFCTEYVSKTIACSLQKQKPGKKRPKTSTEGSSAVGRTFPPSRRRRAATISPVVGTPTLSIGAQPGGLVPTVGAVIRRFPQRRRFDSPFRILARSAVPVVAS